MLVFGQENSVQIVLQGGTYEKCFDCIGGDWDSNSFMGNHCKSEKAKAASGNHRLCGEGFQKEFRFKWYHEYNQWYE